MLGAVNVVQVARSPGGFYQSRCSFRVVNGEVLLLLDLKEVRRTEQHA